MMRSAGAPRPPFRRASFPIEPGQVNTYTWDGENRMTKAVFANGVVDTFTFNADGQRVGRTDQTGTVNYVWDGQNVSQKFSRFKLFHRGFSISRGEGNSLGMGWNSGLNPNRAIDQCLVPRINRAVRRATGKDVHDR